MFRSAFLRKSVRDEPCINCGRIGTTVLAHSNEGEHGKGMGIKAHDLLSLALCHECHTLFDTKMTREEQRSFFRSLYPKQMVRISEKLERGELKL